MENIEPVDAYTANMKKEARTIYTFRLGEDRYFDVMRYIDDHGRHRTYVMQCADGSMVYDHDGNTYPDRIPDPFWEECLKVARSLPAGTLPAGM